MRLLHKSVGLLMVALGVFVCGVAVFVAVSPTGWLAMRALAGEARLLLGCMGAGGLCLVAIHVLSGIGPSGSNRFLSFANESGVVSIGTDAIANYIGKLAPEFPSIVRMSPRVAPRHKTIDVVVDIRIKAGPQLHEICEVLQKRVRESLATGLGISEVRRVVVNVREISSEHKPA